MSQADFLVEIGTEELPPKALRSLSDAFTNLFKDNLDKAGLAYGEIKAYAAPRRLALWVKELALSQPDEEVERRGPAVQAAFDKQGNPSKAAEGFARSCGVTVDQLQQLETDKGSWLVFRSTRKGQPTKELVTELVQQALDKLPIPKRMRWGANRAEFVRPVQWVLMILGEEVVEGEILGISSSNKTRGHRFHAPSELTICNPSDYSDVLKQQGFVLADFSERKELIRSQVEQVAKENNLTAVIGDGLLDEVTALNEWPVALIGQFESRFLEVPAEALVSSMEEHQKYFHTVNDQGQIQPYFIFIANLESKDPTQVISGNEKVIRPRLSDAAFFWETDKKSPLSARVPKLDSILFQKELGSLGDKVTRLQTLCPEIAVMIGSDRALAERAALLSKADLLTDMVFEFTDLQGIAGRYYAEHDGESSEVALAIQEQYLPSGAGDDLPTTLTGMALALSDRLDNLSGLFGIGQPPTGTKDPFALRRAALGVLRILVEKELDLDLTELFDLAFSQHQFSQDKATTAKQQVIDYLMDRFTAWYTEDGIPVEVVHAVRANDVTRPVDFDRRIKAVHAFSKLPEAESLAAANKRVSNILSKVEGEFSPTSIDNGLLTEEAEQALAKSLGVIQGKVQPSLDKGDYQAALAQLASLKDVVDDFFDNVMVMAEQEDLRQNRLTLLYQLRGLFLQVADISLLS